LQAGTRRRHVGTALVIPGFILGAILRVALLPLPGTPDVGSWKAWSFAASIDATSLYGVGGTPPERRLIRWRGITSTTEYPPLGLYELAVAGRVYAAIDPAFADSRVLTVLVKMPGILAEMAIVFALVVWGRKVLGAQAAIWAALAIWLNPAIILNGAALGYLDAQMAAPALLAFVAAGAGRPALAGALTAAAVFTKAQALFVAPVILFTALQALTGKKDFGFQVVRSGDSAERQPGVSAVLGWFFLGGAIASAAIVLPIILRGAWPNMVQAISRLTAHNMLSGNALNAWWLVTWAVRALYALDLGWFRAFTMPVRILESSRFIAIGYPDPKLIGTAIVALWIGWGLWRSSSGRTLAGWAATAGWCVFAYFMFGAQVHENHLYLAVPFFALAAGLDRRFRGPFYAISAISALNMYVFYGLGEGWPAIISRSWTVVDLTVVLSLISLAAFFWATAETAGAGPEARNWDAEEDA
jgi:ALG6/ALG8 glycosyltransferase family protein